MIGWKYHRSLTFPKKKNYAAAMGDVANYTGAAVEWWGVFAGHSLCLCTADMRQVLQYHCCVWCGVSPF